MKLASRKIRHDTHILRQDKLKLIGENLSIKQQNHVKPLSPHTPHTPSLNREDKRNTET